MKFDEDVLEPQIHPTILLFSPDFDNKMLFYVLSRSTLDDAVAS